MRRSARGETARSVVGHNARVSLRSLILLVASALAACSAPEAAGADAGSLADAPIAVDGGRPPCLASATPSRLVVTADWMNRSLTLLGLERVLDPACIASEAIVGTIELGAYAPGPIELEITPDGRTAVVSVGPGFFDGTGGVLVGTPMPEQEGRVLLVDLESRAVTADIATTHVPMGIAIAPDGARAYVAGFGHADAAGSTIAVIDLAMGALIEEIAAVGPRPEQIALSADGALGAVSLAGSSGVRVFETRDVAGTLSPEVMTGRDPSDLAFVPGTSSLVVANSMAISATLLDVSAPSAPMVVASRALMGIPYAVTPIPGTTDVLVSTTLRETLVRVATSDFMADVEPITVTGGAFVIGVAVSADGRAALVPHPREHVLSVIDLETRREHTLRWLDRPGPTYVAIQP